MSGYPYRPDRDDTDVIGARIGAAIIDSVLVGLISALFAILGVTVALGSNSGGIAVIIALFGFVIAFGYYLLLEGLWDGQTVGKKLLNIKVVKESGHPIDLGDSVIRNLLRIVDGLFYYAVGFVFMASSDKRMRLGDRVANTVVVKATPRQTGGQAGRRGQGGGRDQRGQSDRDRY